ncbi:hypothetical protein NDU88_010882 [Pleurodeles waltl]|uniref:Immunoglobulin V-set domain-containing protein n=1 Tax=Pleurodeles waltl TaxID=8319 RepID=A0AAV7Q074_PLEWA|nr:hypothetical protein NDU88_010882 [Pleurodeles waltl]
MGSLVGRLGVNTLISAASPSPAAVSGSVTLSLLSNRLRGIGSVQLERSPAPTRLPSTEGGRNRSDVSPGESGSRRSSAEESGLPRRLGSLRRMAGSRWSTQGEIGCLSAQHRRWGSFHLRERVSGFGASIGWAASRQPMADGGLILLVISFLWKGVLRAQEGIDTYLTVTLPWNVTAQEGLCVLIPCTFTYKETAEAAVTSRGYWFFEGGSIQEKAVATNDVNKEIHEHTRGRFRLVGDVRSRNCSLSINDVRKSDARSYFFRYEHNERSTTKYSYIRYPLRVTVTDLWNNPKMSLPGRVMEGIDITKIKQELYMSSSQQ